ncbi:MAG: haloacid dehalogenase-like hydrolase [Deltaproteobacteria bacterium]|nr:haloacid dehalogenase-like hydrolase [Deltaproteobacteria bacterium]
MSNERSAAFFRAEGVLISRGVVHAATWMAAQRAGFRERAIRFGQAALAAPVFGLLGQNDRSLGNRVAHLAYRDMTSDRIEVLAEEYVEDVLDDKILDSGVELVKQARAAGHRVVILSEGISEIMTKVVERYIRGVDDLVCNHLEYKDIKATGKLLDPVIGGYEGGRWAASYAAEHDIDLSRSIAYAGHGPDLLLLSAVGQPCVVNPDFTLRKAAREADWPVVDYSA